jgi:hypothetical protein
LVGREGILVTVEKLVVLIGLESSVSAYQYFGSLIGKQ